MSEKQLYTLTDIAQKLDVNYKTLYNYKDVFKTRGGCARWILPNLWLRRRAAPLAAPLNC